MLNDNFDHDVGTLTQGMRFQTKEQFLDALNRYHITNHCTYKTTHSNTTRLRVQCVQQLCLWKCQTILRTRDQVWGIRKVEGVHTCATQLITQDHKHLGSKIISQHIRQMVESDPSTPIVTIISSIQTSMGYNNLQKGMVGETTSNWRCVWKLGTVIQLIIVPTTSHANLFF